MSIRLWHDDIRRPPEGWVWARTNKHAKRILESGQVVGCSLDHDLGMHNIDPDRPDAIYLAGQDEETGLDLVDWMLHYGWVPERITIHSWNPPEAQRMYRTIMAKRDLYPYVKVKIQPYEVPE